MHYDLIIVGAGPVGLACGIEAQNAGYSYLILEKGCLTNSIFHWPTFVRLFSTPDLLELGELPFTTANEKPTRRETLVYYRRVKNKFSLNVRQYEEVLKVNPRETSVHQPFFEVISSKTTYLASKVILATGAFDIFTPLNVPGEELPKVTHYYKEPFSYTDCHVLVIGGKNSAVEAALDLYRNGAYVTLVSREPELAENVKYWLKPDLENRIKSGKIEAYFSTHVKQIESDTVTLEHALTGKSFTIKNDFVVALTGYQPDYELLESVGVGVTKDKQFVYDSETMETNVKSIYLAGAVAAGFKTGNIFIENGRRHAKQIIRHIISEQKKE
ncbi:FAD-dependent pyridine nucleotide-disulphide oxidoreductase [Chloroherpeton thalassium ATCC 35110]|uniref:FAD-dependent pyridine nucleotide-disulphide oxidoreductase n=1 Tax=Chloroherpeton thalassium (strain ATCC 35110 / GB-78) TaxID=517418 RepID=B3QZ36_CHLT3|nr:YpdA family putative bacillithiol disulfide reductase [Chloroherpeton thalassium]ACF13729.1 FAD-dependent pyridine nucleotide-disulphide oxidoreductase [Chloroherpeton thalassium ATCC 35110]